MTQSSTQEEEPEKTLEVLAEPNPNIPFQKEVRELIEIRLDLFPGD